MDLFEFDNIYRNKGYKIVAGLDEAGRGPWAGPVVAACVMFPETLRIEGINDSKKLTSKQREKLFEVIQKSALYVGVGIVDSQTIDSLNILKATHLAMNTAIENTGVSPDIVIVDGLPVPGLPCKSEAVVKGDSKSASVAAASIIAKVTRDRIMLELSSKYPNYYFESHKGYGTKQHSDALAKHGPCPVHRKSFAPVRALLE